MLKLGCGLFLVVVAFAVTVAAWATVLGERNEASPISIGLAIATWLALAAVGLWRLSKIQPPSVPAYPNKPTLADSTNLTGLHLCGWACSTRPRARGSYDAEHCPVCGEAPGWAGWIPVGKQMVDVHERVVGPNRYTQRTETRYHNFKCGKCGSISIFNWEDTSWSSRIRITADWRWVRPVSLEERIGSMRTRVAGPMSHEFRPGPDGRCETCGHAARYHEVEPADAQA